MLFHVQMDVQIPHSLDPEVAAQLIAKEKAYSQELQRSGNWRHIWRIVGEYANYSILTSKTTQNCTSCLAICRFTHS